MTDTLVDPICELDDKSRASTVEVPGAIRLELVVTDPDSVKELTLRHEGLDRDDYALGALRIGLLSLKHARGQIDADAVKREGDHLLQDLNHALETYRTQLNENLTPSSLPPRFELSTVNGRLVH